MEDLPLDVAAVLERGLAETAPAIALAVYHWGELVADAAYGSLDPETQRQPVEPGTPFDLASVTKLYTVTAFLMQVAEGRARLDTPVVDIIPEFRGVGARPIAGLQDPHTLEMLPVETPTSTLVLPTFITFRHLLTHTGGLAPWRDLFRQVGPPPPPPGEPDPVPRPQRLGAALKLIAEYPFVDKPGQHVHYSDLGLILLGEAVARLDGRLNVAEVIKARVSGPLGCGATTFNPPDPTRCPPTELDERWRGRRVQGQVHDENAAALGGIAGHAGLFAPAAEVARFGQAWLDAVQGAGRAILPPTLATDATRVHAEDRGLGWVLKTSHADSSAGSLYSLGSFGHTGFTGTSLWIDPSRQLVTALLTNAVYNGRDMTTFALRRAVHDAVCDWVDELTIPHGG
ncbi:MAG: beta-lactamase family protein [Anaerolineae bacterium]|nr:beta-lactamase family protein [Anaerolineae bacterium]